MRRFLTRRLRCLRVRRRFLLRRVLRPRRWRLWPVRLRPPSKAPASSRLISSSSVAPSLKFFGTLISLSFLTSPRSYSSHSFLLAGVSAASNPSVLPSHPRTRSRFLRRVRDFFGVSYSGLNSDNKRFGCNRSHPFWMPFHCHMEYPSAPCNTVFTGGLLREPNNNLVCREDLVRVVVVCSFVHPCSPQFLKIVTLCDCVNGWGSCGVGTRLRLCILFLYIASKVDIYKRSI